jgi:uncharacterized protein YcfJ
MKKKFTIGLLFLCFVAIEMFACPHTRDGSDCEFCIDSRIDKVLDWNEKRQECVREHAAKGAITGAAIGTVTSGVAGTAVGTIGGATLGFIYGEIDCFDGDTYLEDAKNTVKDVYNKTKDTINSYRSDNKKQDREWSDENNEDD